MFLVSYKIRLFLDVAFSATDEPSGYGPYLNSSATEGSNNYFALYLIEFLLSMSKYTFFLRESKIYQRRIEQIIVGYNPLYKILINLLVKKDRKKV